MLLHLAVAAVVPVCLLAGWWQTHQALHGNSLSWAYTVEWPGFAVFAVIAWWHLIHEDPAARAARREIAPQVNVCAGDGTGVDHANASGELSEAYAARVAAAARREYSAHLARLAESERPRTKRKPRAVR